MMAYFQIASSVGNIVGPLLFTVDQKPGYKKGLRAVLGLFVAAIGIVGLLVASFIYLNRRKEAERVANGKPAKIHDRSMDNVYRQDDGHADEEAGAVPLGLNSGNISDLKNDEFVYTL